MCHRCKNEADKNAIGFKEVCSFNDVITKQFSEGLRRGKKQGIKIQGFDEQEKFYWNGD